MLYKVEVVEIYLEKVRGTGLYDDHGGVAPSLFPKREENSSRAPPPYVQC